jgi:hypothetical protein
LSLCAVQQNIRGIPDGTFIIVGGSKYDVEITGSMYSFVTLKTGPLDRCVPGTPRSSVARFKTACGASSGPDTLWHPTIVISNTDTARQEKAFMAEIAP